MRLSAGEIAMAVGGELIAGSPDIVASSAVTDSAGVTPGVLFVPVIGKRVDGHRFIGEAFGRGASVSLCSHPADIDPALYDAPHALIMVDDTVSALQALGSYYRDRYAHITYIGITGSVGKTTTREMTALALSSFYNTYSTKGNANSQVGVPITVLDTPPDAGIGVIELGVSEIGEMERIAAVARPDIAMITNIGVSHIAQFGSKYVTLREKLKIAAYLDQGALIFNKDDELLKDLLPGELMAAGIDPDGIKIRSYGLSDDADVRAADIETPYTGARYTLIIDGESAAKVSLAAPGMHMVINSLAAIAAACECGADPAVAASKLGEFRGFSGRGEIYAIGDMRIINDAYNASPDSMRESLRVLNGMEGTRRIAVLSDMLELGDETARFHREIGEFIGELKGIDMILLYGDEAGHIKEGITGNAPDKITEVRVFDSGDEMSGYLRDILRPGDRVLFKGSNSMGLKTMAEEICATLKS